MKLPTEVMKVHPVVVLTEPEQLATLISVEISPTFVLNNTNKSFITRNDKGDAVTSTQSVKCIASIGVSISSGIACWQFTLTQDELNNEMVCFGITTENCSNLNYETSPSMWMYRAFNGFVICAGKKHKSVFPKLSAGESVKFILDYENKSLSISVGDLDYLLLCDNLPSVPMVPSICFYGRRRTVTVNYIRWSSSPSEVGKASTPSLGNAISSSRQSISSELYFDDVSPSIVTNDNPLVVTSSSNIKAHALLNMGFIHGTNNTWEFAVVFEKTNDEKICFGIGTRPVSSSDYDASPDLWMYRTYNGTLYARGVKSSTLIKPLNKEHTIKCTLNCEEHTLSMEINGVDKGVVFRDLPYTFIYPAICFYGDGRTAMIKNVNTTNGVLACNSLALSPSGNAISVYYSSAIGGNNRWICMKQGVHLYTDT